VRAGDSQSPPSRLVPRRRFILTELITRTSQGGIPSCKTKPHSNACSALLFTRLTHQCAHPQEQNTDDATRLLVCIRRPIGEATCTRDRSIDLRSGPHPHCCRYTTSQLDFVSALPPPRTTSTFFLFLLLLLLCHFQCCIMYHPQHPPRSWPEHKTSPSPDSCCCPHKQDKQKRCCDTVPSPITHLAPATRRFRRSSSQKSRRRPIV
jgi:hypothetical protein